MKLVEKGKKPHGEPTPSKEERPPEGTAVLGTEWVAGTQPTATASGASNRPGTERYRSPVS